jgi:hypothetical protein
VTNERAGIAEITSGVAIGDSVISGNVGSLGKGMQIQIVSPNAGRARASAPAAPAQR